MLIFKNNIYRKQQGELLALSTVQDFSTEFDPYHFVKACLDEEVELLNLIEGHPQEFWRDDLAGFYPRSHRFAEMPVLRKLLEILIEGLEDHEHWYHMNTYHFSLLYDGLNRFAYNYNHDSPQEKLKSLPEMQGKPIYFEQFVDDYFFNTVFLLTEDAYNRLSGKEKQDLGYTCPCQFGAINGLMPCQEEMELQIAKDYPYPVYV
ncbi:hypothetical protein NITGR_660002 [Nitrospina gracilis 3/211]|uniref:Uncharacterized protein n=1 Tax=Nitrospina gracilis (strain 3/211) TaxID=1266370 RepID=M1ZD99_NITG3|nr:MULTISPECIES: hypothetical protein [Nitrospina]MCF8724261.1 hypothetical protein [Nitrospina sp. Nb-3]CCQ91409.1 hypothetical protein NITGR_660002 [Nitrospina gracilis 3/211]